MKIPFVDLGQEYRPYKNEIISAIESVMESGQYIGGQLVERLESQLAEYCGTQFAVTLNSGTDALIFSLMALGIKPGDEVIIPANSFVATANSVLLAGGIPVFVDIGYNDVNLDPEAMAKAITKKTKAVIPVHLSGKPAKMVRIMEICRQADIPVIEDAAQAFGARIRNKRTGCMGDIGCFSFHPLKNLGCMGDGGCIVTNNEQVAHTVQLLRNHGLKDRDTCLFPGYNSRLDAVHAATLMVRLKHYDENLEKRLKIISEYRNSLEGQVRVLKVEKNVYPVYQNFFVFTDKRDELKRFLEKKQISTAIHSHLIPYNEQKFAATRCRVEGELDNTYLFQRTTLSLPVILHDEIKRKYLMDSIYEFFRR